MSALNVEVRNEIGKQVAKRIRRAGRVPGVFYIHGENPVPFSVDAKELRLALAHKSGMMDVQFGQGDPAKCIIREVQWHPVLGHPVHVDLMGVRLTEEVTVEVPIVISGAAAGVKEGGTLQQVLRTLEITCLPLDIPEAITVDVSNLNIHDAIYVRDLKYERIEILNDLEQIIVSVLAPRLEEAAAPAPAAEEAEPEVIERGKKEEEEEAAKK